MIIHALLTLLTWTQVTADSFKNNCFSTRADHAVSNAKPIAELFRVTPSECLNYCISNSPRVGDGCSSLVYHREYSTCQLYSHDGNFEGAEVVPAEGHDYFLRHSYIGICQDAVVPKRGYKQMPRMYGVPSRKHKIEVISMSKRVNLQEVTETQEPVETTTENKYANINVELPSEIQDELQNEEVIPDDAVITSFLNPTRNTGCRKPEKVGYFVLFGYQMVRATKPAKLKGVDQSSCVMYCSQNIDSEGNQRNCTSVNYDPINEECKLYQNDGSIVHTSTLIENKNVIFADKFCVNSRKDCSAESPFIVYPMKQVHKKIVQSFPGMNSIIACIAACIDHSRCKTITYKRGLCILHDTSISLDPTYLVDGSEHTMVVENGCQLTANVVSSMISNQYTTPEPREESEWEEWSACQFGVKGKRVRVRQRECEECEDLQIEPC